MLSKQIGGVCLVAGVGRYAIMFGGERMHDTCFITSSGESPFGRQMVISRTFHDDDDVLDVVLLLGLPNEFDRRSETDSSVLYRSRVDEQIPKVVSHHPLGSVFRGIDAHDGEPLTAHFLDAGSDNPIRFLQRLLVTWLGLTLPPSNSSDVVRHLDSP